MKNVCLAVLAAVTMLSPGCASYSAGTGSKLAFNKIYIAPAKNESFAPQSQAALTKAVRSKFANRPDVALSNSPDGAAILEMTIVKYGQSEAGHKIAENRNGKRKHRRNVQKVFSVKMTVSCTLTDGATGNVLFKDHMVSSSVECCNGDSYQIERYGMMPQLFQKIADKIYTDICSVW